MNPINVGWLSLLPPLVAISLALITKEVLPSLLLGILTGTAIYCNGNLMETLNVTFELMSNCIGNGAKIILFLALLGALVVVVTKSGGSKAYGDWAIKRIKTRKGAQIVTNTLGSLIFIDDYFSCLTVGTVMRPVTDKHRISREKLAYLIDSTAAPICIIMPLSSWAVAVGGTIEQTGYGQVGSGMSMFIQTIPYNLYAWLTLILIWVISIFNLDFGKMREVEQKAQRGISELKNNVNDNNLYDFKINNKGKVFDLLIPIATLIIFSIISMIYIGGFFNGGVSLFEAFTKTDVSLSLIVGSFIALLVSFFMFIPRKILTLKEFFESITIGVKSMVSAFIILVLAWSISEVCTLLGTGNYVGNVVTNSNIPLSIIPSIMFVVSGFLSLATGTSWGAFAILIPIVIVACGQNDPSLTTITLSATLAGAVYGDHISPISDTTILSSTGAKCNHMNHVSTQILYASVIAAICFLSYFVAGVTRNAYITFSVALVLLILVLIFVYFKYNRGNRLNENKSI